MSNRHEPSDEQRRIVKSMAGYGIPQTDIGRVIGISVPTLEFYYREELDTGMIVANAAVAQNLFKKATGEGRESVTAAIFWLKCRAGWSEYSAPPPPKPPEPLGKKEQAQVDAENASAGTEWGHLVN